MFRPVALQARRNPSKPRVSLLALAIAVFALWTRPACAQDLPAAMHVESAAPSIHVSYAGQEPDSELFQVRIENQSQHVLTEISEGGGPNGSRAWNSALITPGGVYLRGGNLGNYLLEAALFDDNSYE